MGTLKIPKSIWEKTTSHLFQDANEHLAFFLVGIEDFKGEILFLVKDVIIIQEEDLDISGSNCLKLKLKALLKVTNAARLKKLAIIEAHSHPFSKNNVTFSYLDEYELKDFAQYMIEDLNLPYGAIVLGKSSIDGEYWYNSRIPKPILEVCIVGENFIRLFTTSGKKFKNHEIYQNIEENHLKFDRQIQAIGREGQKKIENTKVAIAGAGGIASHIIQQLAYLGVKDFTIIDFDNVEKSNLNRLIGANDNDIGLPKTQIMERMIYSIAGNKGITINIINANIRNSNALELLKKADVIFGCVDNDGARLILNEVALAYHIPLIDCGVGLNTKEGKLIEAGGRVMVVHSDGPCLLCAKEIDLQEASNYLVPKEELEVRRKLGYVKGEDIKNPSVVSIDGTIASIAVTEFFAMVTSVRELKVYTFYDLIEQKIVQRIIKENPNCFQCSLKGEGYKIDIERYSFPVSTNDISNISNGILRNHEVANISKIKEVI